MMRPEMVIAGCVLALVGLGLCFFGYQQTQPTLVDTAVGILEQLSKQKAPADLKSDKSQGYIMIALGGIAFVGGVALILGSRQRVGGGS